MVVISLPSAWTASTVQDFTARLSRWIVQAPQTDVSHPIFVPVSPSSSRMNSVSSVRGSTPASCRAPLTVSAIDIKACLLSDERCLELAQATGAAEVVRPHRRARRVARARRPRRSSANGIDCLSLDQLGGRGGPGVPPRDELGEDGDGDLLLARGAEVEARRAADTCERLLVEPARAELAEAAAPFRARPPGRRSRLCRRAPLPARPRRPAHRGDDDASAPGMVAGMRQPSVGRVRASVRARGALADHREESAGRCGSTSTSIVPSDAQRSDRAVTTRPLRRPSAASASRTTCRLGAGAANPADERAVTRDERVVAAPRRGRPLDATTVASANGVPAAARPARPRRATFTRRARPRSAPPRPCRGSAACRCCARRGARARRSPR